MFKNAKWKKLLIDIIKVAIGFITGLITENQTEMDVLATIWNHGIQ